MLQFYKPNSKNTGSACSFSYNQKDKSFWVNFVRQSSWDGQKKRGFFNGSGPDKKANSKFNVTELAGLVHAIETNGEFGNFHGSKEKNTTFKFSPYVREGKQVGFSFTLAQSNTEQGTKKSFLIGFSFPEGRLLKQYALTVLNNYFSDCIEESQFSNSHPTTSKKTEEKVEKVPSTEDNNQEIDLDAPW